MEEKERDLEKKQQPLIISSATSSNAGAELVGKVATASNCSNC